MKRMGFMRQVVSLQGSIGVIAIALFFTPWQSARGLSTGNQQGNSVNAIDVRNCKETHEVFPIDIPKTGPNGQIIEASTTRARYRLQKATTLVVVEKPQSSAGNDLFNSTIIIRNADSVKEYSLAKLIKRGGYFRLLRATSFCSKSDHGVLILAFQAGWTRDWEAYVMVRWSRGKIDVNAFPTVSQGRIVVSRSDPRRVELWSAVAADMDVCDACPKHYEIQDCRVSRNSVQCRKRPKVVGPLSPNDFDGKGITLK